MSEVYEVQITDPNFPGERPMPFILVDGKIQSMPCKLKLRPGDRVIIERVVTHEIAAVEAGDIYKPGM